MNKKIIVIVVFGLLTLKSYSQNIPLGTLPMLYNGGFAGEGNAHRYNTGVSFYKKPFSPQDRYFSYFYSMDLFIPKLSTGIGLTQIYRQASYNNDIFGVTKDNIDVSMISLSPKISLKGKYTIAPFINFIFFNDRLKQDASRPTYISLPSIHFRVTERIGFLFNSRKFYFGISANSLNNAPAYANEIHSPWRYISGSYLGYMVHTYPYGYRDRGLFNCLLFQGGYTFQKRPESKFSFTPQVAVQYMKYEDIGVDFNLMFRYSKFLWSLNNNGIGLGFQSKLKNGDIRVLLSQSYLFDKNEKMLSLTLRVSRLSTL
jgi:hypothetical protein